MNKDKTISFRITEHDQKKLDAIRKYYEKIYPDITITTTMLLDICINRAWEQIEIDD